MQLAIWKSVVIPLVASAVLIGSGLGVAQIYKYEDDQGNVVFSDRKPSDTDQQKSFEEVHLKATNTTPAPAVKAPDQAALQPAKADKQVYATLITQPASGTTIPMGPGNFEVIARADPPLGTGESLRLLLDDAPIGKENRSGIWALNNIFRGEHSLVVERLASDQQVLDRSRPATVYVLRPSVRR